MRRWLSTSCGNSPLCPPKGKGQADLQEADWQHSGVATEQKDNVMPKAEEKLANVKILEEPSDGLPTPVSVDALRVRGDQCPFMCEHWGLCLGCPCSLKESLSKDVMNTSSHELQGPFVGNDWVFWLETRAHTPTTPKRITTTTTTRITTTTKRLTVTFV